MKRKHNIRKLCNLLLLVFLSACAVNPVQTGAPASLPPPAQTAVPTVAPTAAATSAPQAVLPTQQPAAQPAFPAGIRVLLDSVLSWQSGGYLVRGHTEWDRADVTEVSLPDRFLKLVDAKGQVVNAEWKDSTDGIHAQTDQQVSWAYRTESKDLALPLTLVVERVRVRVKSGHRFQVDFGATPQKGQRWVINELLSTPDYTATIQSAEYMLVPDEPRLGFDVTGKQVDFVSMDLGAVFPDESGSSAVENGIIHQEISNIHGIPFPTGKQTIIVNEVSYSLTGPWRVEGSLKPAN